MLGKERSHLKNSLFSFFVSDKNKPIFNLFLEKIFTGKTKESCEIALSANENSPVYVQLTGMVTENWKQCLISMVDITEHKRVEEERLESSEERYQSLYENAKIGLYRTTPDGTIVLANKALVKMLGYTSFNELAKVNVKQDGFETPNQRKAFLEKIEQTGEVENFETTWIRQDRTPVFVRESARAIRDSLGNTIYYDGTAEDITQLKHTQDELDWNMALLAAKANSTTPNSSVDAILVVDQKGKKIFQNQLAADLLKVPQHIANEKDDESELQWVASLNKDPQHFIERVKYLYSHPNEISKDVLEYKDGTFLDRYTAPVVGKDGKYYGRLWIFRDITERRRTKEALRESEARYRLLFEKSADGILIADVETKMFKYANPALCRMLGYPEGEITTLGLADIHPEQDFQRVIAEFESLTRGDKTLAPDIPCLRKDGIIVYADINSTNITIDGRLCAVGLFRDITERKRAEEALQKSEIQLQVIIESTADGILAIDGNGKVIKTNNRFAELWRIPPAILNSGDDATLLNFVLEQLISPKQFLDKVHQLYNSTDEDSDTLFFKDGRIFERYSAPLILDDKIIGRVWSFRDITERKRAEEALQQERGYVQ
ncbi:MAG: PAS domain-containing protein, partial [Bacteroidota bacterium]|nr:PAS domain-containing protein [Bacteroidota bacterium]